MSIQKKSCSLYFHIPFCSHKCDYCHFFVLPDREKDKQQLLDSFRLEWLQRLPLLENKTITSIYFGGGTPALFGPARIEKVLKWIYQESEVEKEAEVTLEVNPENINFSDAVHYQQSGINRISMGVQILDDQLLQIIGRKHTASTALEAVYEIDKAGIKNISIDLMYDLPHQKLSHWQHTLTQVTQLPIAHLSLYNLTIEPHTIFFKKKEALKPHLPNEQLSLQLYETAIEQLEEAGLKQYEISAFCKNGQQALHNIGYWIGRPFLGFGPSAFSYWENKRFKNISHLNKYTKLLQQGQLAVDFEETLDPQARIRELLTIGLRLNAGVDLALFEKEHGRLSLDTHQTLAHLIQLEVMNLEDHKLKLTKRGRLCYDTIAVELI